MDEPEKAYTKIFNTILDTLISHRISGQEYQIVLFIIRKTNGYHKTCDNISMGQISKATGIKRPNVSRLLTALCEKNIISVMQKDNTKINCLSLQTDISAWRVFPKKITPVMQKDNTATIIKKTRQKKTRQKKEFVPPTLEEVINFFAENGYSEYSAEKAWKYYEDGDPVWHDQYGNPVLNWKQKFRAVWFKNENKKEAKTPAQLKEEARIDAEIAFFEIRK